MVLDQLASVATPVIYGLGFRQSFALTRSFTVGWKEQQGLCSFDYLIGIGTLVTAAYSNLEALKGTAFANNVWRYSYGAYAAVPALYYCMSRLHASEAREQNCEKVLREFPPANDEDTRSVGERVQERFFKDGVSRDFGNRFDKIGPHDSRSLEKRIFDYLEDRDNWMETQRYQMQYMTWDHAKLSKKMARDESAGNGRVAALVKLFPKSGKDDARTLGERIDADSENHTRSTLEKKTKEVLDFAFMHIPDALLLASVTHTVAAMYIGFNQTANLVNLLFYGWSVAEQGLFWDKPAEDKGFLMSLKDGEIVRAYEPYVSKITEYNTLLYMFLFRGIIGKALCALAVFLKYSPDSWKSAVIPEVVKKKYDEAVKFVNEEETLQNFKVLSQTQPDPNKDFAPPLSLDLSEQELHLMKPFLECKFSPTDAVSVLDSVMGGEVDFFETMTVEASWDKLQALLGDNEDAQEAKQYVERLNNTYGGNYYEKVKKNLWGMLVEGLECNRRATLRTIAERRQENMWLGLEEEHKHFATLRVVPVERHLKEFIVQKISHLPIPNVQKLAGTKKMLEKFVLEDLFPDQSMAEMEKALQDKLNESLQKEEASAIRNQEALERLLGKDGGHGWLYSHVMESRDPKEKEEKEVQLKAVFGAAARDWEHWMDVLAGRNEGCLCRPATAQTLYETALEAYPEISGMEGHDGPQQGVKNRLTAGIQLVLQQRRDLTIQSGLQTLSYVILQQEEMIREEVAEGMQQNTEDQAAENGWTGRVRGWAQAGLTRGALECCFGIAHGIGTSRHINNLATTFVGEGLGLSNYDEAERDVSKMLNRIGLETSLFNLPKDALKPFVGIFQNYAMLYGTPGAEGVKPALDTLIEATYVQEDKRIKLEDVQEYLKSRFNATKEEKAAVFNFLRVNHVDDILYDLVDIKADPGEFVESDQSIANLLRVQRNMITQGSVAFNTLNQTVEGGAFRDIQHKREYLLGLNLDTLSHDGNEEYFKAANYLKRVEQARVIHDKKRAGVERTNAIITYFDETFRNMEPITPENVDQVEHQSDLWFYLEDNIEVIEEEDHPAIVSYRLKQEKRETFEKDCSLAAPIDNSMFEAAVVGNEEAAANIARAHEIREAYTVRANLFLNKYLPQVLYDLGFFGERD